VRSVLVPALVTEIGDRIWWPSALSRRAGHEPEPRARPQPASPGPPAPEEST
jgi:RND superfamily putative drug exporter